MTNQIKEQFSKQFNKPWEFLTFFYALSDELYGMATHIHEYIFFMLLVYSSPGEIMHQC